MKDCNGVGTPMLEIDRDRIVSAHSPVLDEDSKQKYQQLIGCLLYLMHCTRPNIAYSIIRLSQFTSRPEKHHLDALKHVLRYLKATRTTTLALGKRSEVVLQRYFDSAHADGIEKQSTSGYVFLFHGSLISWQSKVQKVIALFSTEAEYVAASEAGWELVWLRGLLQNMGMDVPPTVIYGDNMGSNALTRNPEFHQRTKHIELRQCFITSLVTNGSVQVQYIPSNAMLADSLTKPLSKDQHELHWDLMGLSLKYEEKKGKRKFEEIS